VRLAQEKASLELYEQALDTLREALRTNATSAAAPAAYLLMGSIHERRGHFDDAIGSYLDVHGRFPVDGLAPQALFNMAGATLKTRQAGKEAQAARIYTDVAARYPASPWAARALMARAELEGRRRTSQFDPTLGRPVPATLVTYRAIVQDHPRSAEREHALWRLADLYADLKRYDLAAFALRDLATAYPATAYDAWFTAAELFHKRLNDRMAARSAYAQVPTSSPNWSDAQKRLATN
jgi:TolA-binding protein